MAKFICCAMCPAILDADDANEVFIPPQYGAEEQPDPKHKVLRAYVCDMCNDAIKDARAQAKTVDSQ